MSKYLNFLIFYYCNIWVYSLNDIFTSRETLKFKNRIYFLINFKWKSKRYILKILEQVVNKLFVNVFYDICVLKLYSSYMRFKVCIQLSFIILIKQNSVFSWISLM